MKKIELVSNSIEGVKKEHCDILKQRLDELSTVISRRGPPASFIITTDFAKLDQDHNDGLPFVATSDPETNTIFLHPYFFSLSKEKQLEILTRELICYLCRDIRDRKNILLETKAILALGKLINKVRTISNDADIVIGVPFYKEFDTVENVCNTIIEGFKKYYPDKKCVLICLGNPDIAINEEIGRRIEKINSKSANVRLITFISPVQGKGMALRFMMESSLALNASACAFIDADERKITPEWPRLLLDPVLSGKHDFVSARYARHHHSATITNHFAYPLMSALYGKLVRQPLGGEFAFSSDLMSAYLDDPDVWITDVGTYGIDNWLTSTAIINAAAMCEVDLGLKAHNFSYFDKRTIMFKQVAKALFSQIKQNISYWKEIDFTQPNEIVGPGLNLNPGPVVHDYRTWIKSAKENYTNNRKVYKEILSPGMNDYLENIFGLGDDKFDFSSEKWVDCVYGFIDSYISRNMDSNEAFWNALLALWQARVGSFMRETRDASREQAEKIIEDQLKMFVDKKQHLIEQWKDKNTKIETHPKVEVINPSLQANVKFFIFDWDGTIIHTVPQWKDIIKQVLSDLCRDANLSTDKLPYHLGSAGVIHWAVREAKRRDVSAVKSEREYAAEYIEAINRWFLSLKDSDRLIPGAKEFLNLLSNQDFKLFVLTAAYQPEKDLQARTLGINGLFEEIIGKKDRDSSRFKIEQFQDNIRFKTEQLRRIKGTYGLSRDEIAMFGDRPFDILSAKEAGVIAVGIAEDGEARRRLIAAGADIIINGDYNEIDLLPILNKKAQGAGSAMIKNQTDYIDKNKALFKDMLGENKPDTLVRVPLEAIESIGMDNIKDFLVTFQEAPNGYIELYYMSGTGGVSESVYQKYGLTKKQFPEDLKDPKKRTRANTITLFATLKGYEIDEAYVKTRLGSFDMTPKNTILIPIGLQHDQAGLVRATILGLKIMNVARRLIANPALAEDQAFKDDVQTHVLQDLLSLYKIEDLKDLGPDDIIALASSTNIIKLINSLKKLIDLLPITPINAEELRQIYEHAKAVITAA